MAVKVAINGFGRIGRNTLRAIIESGRTDIEVVAINGLAPIETLSHLFRHDSVHGRFPGKVTLTEDTMDVGRGPIRVTSNPDPGAIDWSDVDVLMECTGIFNTKDKVQPHLAGGAKRVLISAPGAGADKTIVYGVNHDTLTKDDIVVSNASCTTNCIVPVVKVLHEAIGIEKGQMTTIHSYTGDQPTLDRGHRDLYRARAAAMSIIPTSTGAAKAVGLVLPELAGRLDGVSVRVPTPNVSLVDFKFVTERDTTVEEIHNAIRAAADGPMKNILAYTEEKLVSIDFNGDPHSAIFHMDKTAVMGGNLVTVLVWYDNEWGFSNRMNDTAVAMGKLI